MTDTDTTTAPPKSLTPFRLVVGFVGLTLLVATGGIIALAATGHPAPDVLQNIAVGALTGLVGLLVSPQSR